MTKKHDIKVPSAFKIHTHVTRDSDELVLVPCCFTESSSSCGSAGARASAGSSDDRDSGPQELLVQQDSRVSEELRLFFLQLHIPDPVLPKGRDCLDQALVLPFPCRMHTRAEQHKLKKQKDQKCSIPFPDIYIAVGPEVQCPELARAALAT